MRKLERKEYLHPILELECKRLKREDRKGWNDREWFERMVVALGLYAGFLALMLSGCSPLRHYRMAGGTGDLTHVAEPGARVVVPKKQAPAPKYVRSPRKPGVDCVEIDHKVEEYVRTWACPR